MTKMTSGLLRTSVQALNKLPFSISKYSRHVSTCLPPKEVDVLIAGGGIMGLTTAYFLAKRIDPNRICIIERDNQVIMQSTIPVTTLICFK